MLTLIACPDCGAPAEIAERFSLPSTDGPVPHIVVDCAAGHHFRMAEDRLPRRPAVPRVLRRTIQVCIRCQENPAGFWVSRQGGTVTRRPWCLACSAGLDRDRCEVIPFGG